MLGTHTTRPPRFGARFILLLLLLLPSVGGAVAAAVSPDLGHGAPPTVLIVGTEVDTPGSPAGELAATLAATPGYVWQTTSATDAARRLTEAGVFAVVTVPDSFGAPTTKPVTGQVTVVPGTDAGDPGYVDLEHAVSAAANRAGLEGLLVSVSRARTNLNVAALTAAGLKAAAANADTTVNEVLASVTQLVGQADPLVAQAHTLVGAIREYSILISDLSGTLSGFATSMRDVTLTLGDLQNGVATTNSGVQLVLDTLQATAAMRTQLGAVVRPVADALDASGIPEGRRVAGELTALLAAVSGLDDPRTAAQIGSLQSGTELLGEQLGDLSGLLGRPVDAQTRLVDVLDLAVVRLNDIGDFLVQGDATINQVLGQLTGARDLVPTMESEIRGQLDQLKAATTQLVSSLNAGVTGLPDTSAATVDGLSRSPSGPREATRAAVGPTILQAAMIVLLGAMILAVAGESARHRLGSSATGGTRALVVTGFVLAGLAVAAAATTRVDANHGAVFACAVLAVLATASLSTALIRLVGSAGVCLGLASAALVAALDAVARPDGAPAGHLVPGHYVPAVLDSAVDGGITTAVALPAIVLATSALIAVTVAVRLSGTSDGSRQSIPGSAS